MLHDSISRRIAILRFVMIFGIVMLHTPLFVPVTQIGGGAFDLLKSFFQNAAFRTTVAVLTAISGYLLFSTQADRRYPELVRKKLRALVLPFLAFNLSLMAAAFLAQWQFGLALSIKLLPFEPMTWLNAAFGLTSSPINYPLNFLRDLIVLMFMAPLFGFVIRRAAWPGLLLVVLVFYLDLDSYLVLRPSMPVMFYVGGMAALHKWDLRALDPYARACLAVFLLLCAAVLYFRITNTTFLRLSAPVLIWPAASLLMDTRLGKWAAAMSKYSFFIFVAHAPLLMASWLLYQRFAHIIPYELYWIAAPAVVVALLVAIHKAAMRHMPRAFRAVLGMGLPERTRHAPLAAPAHAAQAGS